MRRRFSDGRARTPAAPNDLWRHLSDEERRLIAKLRRDLFYDRDTSRTVAERREDPVAADDLYNGLDAEDAFWWTGAEHRNTDDQGEILEAYGVLPSERLGVGL